MALNNILKLSQHLLFKDYYKIITKRLLNYYKIITLVYVHYAGALKAFLRWGWGQGGKVKMLTTIIGQLGKIAKLQWLKSPQSKNDNHHHWSVRKNCQITMAKKPPK